MAACWDIVKTHLSAARSHHVGAAPACLWIQYFRECGSIAAAVSKHQPRNENCDEIPYDAYSQSAHCCCYCSLLFLVLADIGPPINLPSINLVCIIPSGALIPQIISSRDRMLPNWPHGGLRTGSVRACAWVRVLECVHVAWCHDARDYNVCLPAVGNT